MFFQRDQVSLGWGLECCPGENHSFNLGKLFSGKLMHQIDPGCGGKEEARFEDEFDVQFARKRVVKDDSRIFGVSN